MQPRSDVPVFLRGRKTILRPLNKETDLPRALVWINDPDIRANLANILPKTKKDEEAWFDRPASDKEIVFAIDTAEGEFIGVMDIHAIDWRNGIATTGALIGESDYRGKGYGTDAKMALLGYAFNTLGLRKIRSEVYAFNTRSIAYSLRCGYKKEGRLKKEIFRNGRWWDKVLLAVFRKSYLAAARKYEA